MMHKGLRKDYIWNSVGVFLQNAISPLLLVVITRVNGIYDSGLFSFAFALAIIFWGLGMWGGRTYQVSDVKGEFSRRSFIMVRIVLALFMVLGAIVFSVLNGYDYTKSLIIIALVVFKAVESIADALYGIMQTSNKLYVSGKSLTYKAVAGFVVFVLIDLITKDILLASIGVVLVNVILVIFYDIRIAKGLESLRLIPAQAYIREALTVMRRTTPIFIISFLAMFSLNIPRYFLDIYHPEEIGYFGILAMPVTLIVLFVSFILQPNIVRLSRIYSESKYSEFGGIVRNIIYVTVAVGASILLAAYFVGVPVLELIFGIDFEGYKLALMVMVLGALANAMVAVFINILTVMRRFKSQFYILLITNIILVIASMLIIKGQGIVSGVALFTLINIAQVALLLFMYVMILKGVRYNEKN